MIHIAEHRPSKLIAALVAARKSAAPVVKKSGRNQQQSYNYVGHEHVLVHGGARKVLLDHGLVLLLESYEFAGAEHYRTKSGESTMWRWRGRFTLSHAESGELRELVYEATTVTNDKAGFVASTALDRTAHMRVLELAGSESENPEHDSNNSEPAKRERKAQQDASVRRAPEAAATERPRQGDRELPTTAEGWRTTHKTVCDQLAKDAGITPGPSDELGLSVPTMPLPSFSAEAKQHAGKRYDQVPAGYLREVIWKKARFAEASAPQRLWVSYFVVRAELEKLEQEAAERALGRSGAA